MSTSIFCRCSAAANLSSGTYPSAPVGQCLTQSGTPSHWSHRCATRVIRSNSYAQNGHAHTHAEQPIHFSAATKRAFTGPPSKVAPVGQANRQAGTSHCMQSTGALSICPLVSSDMTRSRDRSGQQEPVWLRLQTISQIRQPLHFVASILIIYRMVCSDLIDEILETH